MKICFVVLHYQNIKVTKQCVKYLQKLEDYGGCKIVVVDNASPNKSGKELLELYKSEENIYVLCNNSNLGFANGNNVGYTFAKNKLKSNVIVVMNNDVFIEQSNFIIQLKRLNNDSKVQLVAPDIINLNGFHQNPFRKESISDKRLKKIYRYNLVLKILYKIPFINTFLANILQYRNIHKKITNDVETNSLYNIVPHGSCIIYLRTWIQRENFAFLPETFMYFEEDILFEYAMKNNYVIKYFPELHVKHIEDASINVSTKTELKKRQFIANNILKSTRILINIRKL